MLLNLLNLQRSKFVPHHAGRERFGQVVLLLASLHWNGRSVRLPTLKSVPPRHAERSRFVRRTASHQSRSLREPPFGDFRDVISSKPAEALVAVRCGIAMRRALALLSAAAHVGALYWIKSRP